MLILHTSDWHLGRSFHREDLLPAQGEFCRWLLEVSVDRNVDVVVVSGDLFDRAVPPVDAVRLVTKTLGEFARAQIPVVVIAGNHDSAARLGFNAELAEAAGTYIRTDADRLGTPVTLLDDYGPVHFYPIPYLDPDLTRQGLGADRSHADVLRAAMQVVHTDRAERGGRSVVLAHAFVTGGGASDSERDISVGGINDVPASVFDGVNYVALGHLHGAQRVQTAAGTVARYSGSPLRYSFSEEHHNKSVALVHLDAAGAVDVELLAVPQPFEIATLSGQMADLLTTEHLAASHGQSRVRITVTDPQRPERAFEKLRAVFPHLLEVRLEPQGGQVTESADLARLRAATTPADLGRAFLDYVTGAATDAEVAVYVGADESARAHDREPVLVPVANTGKDSS